MKTLAAMRAKGYSDEESADQILFQQVRCKVKINRGGNIWTILRQWPWLQWRFLPFRPHQKR